MDLLSLNMKLHYANSCITNWLKSHWALPLECTDTILVNILYLFMEE